MKSTQDESLTEHLEKFAEWLNINQWRGDKGDKLKTAFCSCKYDLIVQEYLKQIEEKKIKNYLVN